MLHLADILQNNTALPTANPNDQIIAVVFDNATRTFLLQTQTERHGDTVTTPQTQLKALFVGQPAYDTNGIFLGEVADAEFLPDMTLKRLHLGGIKLTRSKVAAVGDIVVVKAKSAQKRRTTPPKHNTPQTATTPAPQTDTLEKPHNVQRKYGDFGFLVGKTVNKTLVNFQGEVMVKAGETVTKDILRQAKVSGKLIELYLNCD